MGGKFTAHSPEWPCGIRTAALYFGYPRGCYRLPADLPSFGLSLRRLREARGIQQKEIVDRVANHYSSERAYRRVENGERRPDRDAVIDILLKGLRERDAERIDELLLLAGYEGLTESECTAFGVLRRSTDETPEGTEDAVIELPREESTASEASPKLPILLASAAAVAVVLSAIVVFRFDRPPPWFLLTTSVLYAALYGVSILLETAFGTDGARAWRGATFAFCFVLLTSVAALAVDAACVETGRPQGLWLALAIFFLSAALQWIALRRVLPAESIVPLTFQAHTAQAAHLKNTVYYLAAVILFWLPPMNSILTLDREFRIGSHPFVLRMAGGGLSVGLWYLKMAGLWIAFVVILGISIPMRTRLLDNLPPHPCRNRYSNLFYIRAILYFLLDFVCVSWYSYSIDRLLGA